MRALVTGGAGFVGSHVVDLLLAEGHEVVILDNLDLRVHPPGPWRPPEGATLVRGDVRRDDDLRAALAGGADVVFHQAAMVGVGRGARDAHDYLDVNVAGTLRLLRALGARPPERVVLASTMALYGEGAYACPRCEAPREGARREPDLDAGRWEPACPECGADLEPRPCTEAHPPRGATVYAASKLAQEALAFAVGRGTGLPVVALRYHNVYGPRMPRDTPYAGVASMFKSRVLAGQPPLVHEDGRQLRDFVHVEDVARANLLAARAPLEDVTFEAFNVGTGRPRSIMDLAAALCRALRPDLAPARSGRHRAGDARHVFASVEKARRVLGHAPRVPFEEGVARFAREPTREAPGVPA